MLLRDVTGWALSCKSDGGREIENEAKCRLVVLAYS